MRIWKCKQVIEVLRWLQSQPQYHPVISNVIILHACNFWHKLPFPIPLAPSVTLPRFPPVSQVQGQHQQERTAAALHTRLEGLRAPQVWLPAGGPPEEQVSDAEDQT